MADVTAVEQADTLTRRFKEQKDIFSGATFTFGSKHGLVRAAVGRVPWERRVEGIPNAQFDTLAVRLGETHSIPRLTSRLQLIIGRDEQGTFYIENMSRAVAPSKESKGSKGVALAVKAEHFPQAVTLNPQEEGLDNSASRFLLGGTAASLRGLEVRWGSIVKGFPTFSLRVEDASDSVGGWKAKVKYVYTINE